MPSLENWDGGLKPWGCFVCICMCVIILKFYECFLSLEAVCVFVCMHVDVCELGTLGESWLATQKIFNPPSQFSRLGIQVSLAIMFVCLGYGWVGYFTFLFFAMHMYFHVHVYTRWGPDQRLLVATYHALHIWLLTRDNHNERDLPSSYAYTNHFATL